MRWLVERIDRNHAETTADIAELKTVVAGIPAAMDRYVLVKVYEADERAREIRFARLEDHDKTQTAGGKAWLLGIGLAVLGAVLGWLAQIMQARGGH